MLKVKKQNDRARESKTQKSKGKNTNQSLKM